MLKIMTSSTPEIKVKDLDHCKIITGIIDELELVPQNNSLCTSFYYVKITTVLVIELL